MTRLSIPLVLLMGFGCSSADKAVPCSKNSECEVGQVCLEEECKTVECISSAECDIGKHCTADYTCTAGCEEDTDCLAGETCNDGTCEAYGCRNTQLDCGYGEFCDPTTGQCYPDDSGACSVCDPSTDPNCLGMTQLGPCSSSGACPANQACYITEYDDSFTCSNDSQCAADENCYNLGTISDPVGPYCTKTACFEGATFPACDPSVPNECARGFQCTQLDDGSGICFGDCEWLKANGYL